MIATLLGFVVTPMGKALAAALAAIAVVALCAALVAQHDAKIRAQDQASVAAATMRARADAAERQVAVAIKERDEARAAAIQQSAIKERIRNVTQQVSQVCLSSPGARAMLDGLQPGAGGGATVSRSSTVRVQPGTAGH